MVVLKRELGHSSMRSTHHNIIILVEGGIISWLALVCG